MGLLRDIWELVDGPKPPNQKKEHRLLAFFWRGVGVVVLLFLVAADLPPQPVIVTEDLSFEVVMQMEEAGEACRTVSNLGESSCAGEVWKACHIADQDLSNLEGSPSPGEMSAMRFLCDLAVITDAGELAGALTSRYGDEYFRSGWFKTVKIDEGNASFLLFQDLLSVELSVLINPVDIGTDLVDPIIIWTPSNYVIAKLRKSRGYDDMSGDTEKKLLALRSSVRYFFQPYAGYGSAYYVDLHAVGTYEDQDWGAIGRSLWRQPPDLELNHEITEQNCWTARIAVRESQQGWERLQDSCRHLADTCEEKADRFSVSCSLAKGAAEFESMWQRLPEVCALAGERVENPASDEEPAADACNQAALAICEYQNVSPEDEWLDHLISMRDFACAAASRTPDLQFVKVDERAPEYRPAILAPRLVSPPELEQQAVP